MNVAKLSCFYFALFIYSVSAAASSIIPLTFPELAWAAMDQTPDSSRIMIQRDDGILGLLTLPKFFTYEAVTDRCGIPLTNDMRAERPVYYHPYIIAKDRTCLFDEESKSLKLLELDHLDFVKNVVGMSALGHDDDSIYFAIKSNRSHLWVKAIKRADQQISLKKVLHLRPADQLSGVMALESASAGKSGPKLLLVKSWKKGKKQLNKLFAIEAAKVIELFLQSSLGSFKKTAHVIHQFDGAPAALTASESGWIFTEQQGAFRIPRQEKKKEDFFLPTGSGTDCHVMGEWKHGFVPILCGF